MKEPNFNLTQKAIKATIYSILYRSLTQIVGEFSRIVLVRILPERDYGVYNLLYSFIALLGMIFTLGINIMLQCFTPEDYSQGDFILANKRYNQDILSSKITIYGAV